jgi:hypothetical protein
MGDSHVLFATIPIAIMIPTLMASQAPGQSTNDPFRAPIPAAEGVITVKFVEFASIPDSSGVAPRMMRLLEEPRTRRLFVNTMNGRSYPVSYDGKTVTEYLDVSAPAWGVNVQFNSHERGVQSFALHPQFKRRGARGYGKIYRYTDTASMAPKADFLPSGDGRTHDLALLEWMAKNP